MTTLPVSSQWDFSNVAWNVGQLIVGKGPKTATSSAGAVTLNMPSGVITTESLATAASGVYTLTLTNNQIAATDIVLVSVGLASATTGTPSVASVKLSAGQAVIQISNDSTGSAFNGTLTISFVVVNV